METGKDQMEIGKTSVEGHRFQNMIQNNKHI